MVRLILAFVFLVLALAGIVVRKTYDQLPPRELKRRARHDATAERLYSAVAYGSSVRTLLWLYIGLTSAASVVLLARVLPLWVSLLIVGPVLWVVFSLIPATRLTPLGERITLVATPVIAWILNYLHPLLGRAGEKVEARYVAAQHTRLFERDDLLDLIDRQRNQTDSRFTTEELDIAARALTFSEQSVSDTLTLRKSVKILLADDTVGPILIDEVIKSEQEFVLVRDSKKGPFIGVLATNQLGLKSSGQVRDLMNPTVYYLHEDDTLAEALHAFFVTNFPLFVVVNSFEEFVGTISMANILEQLLGHIPGDNFDQYADLSAVAARHTPEINEDSESIQTDHVEET